MINMSDIKTKINEANNEAIERLLKAEAHWVGMKKVIDAVPGFKPNMILHSGPPIDLDRMSPAQKRGIVGGVLHEKIAKTEKEALGMIESGEIIIRSANDMFCVGPGVGITTASMVTNICEDVKTGLRGYCIPFEGRSGLGAWGVYNEEVEKNLQEIQNIFAPAVNHVLQSNAGINIKSILARGMQMGDESHTRQTACSLMLISEITPMLLNSDLDNKTISHVIKTFLSTERWFHPLGMASSMASIRSIKGMSYCTIVTSIAQNGVDTGIKVADLGEEWFLAPAPYLDGEYFSTQWGSEDAAPYLGDSTVTEAMGMGGFSAAAAPVVLRLRGGGYREAIAQSEEMKQICAGINHNFQIPLLDFTGPGLGIDIRKVVETSITPYCHGGIISKDGGQIGAGGARFPMDNYEKALYSFCEKYNLL